ncbi:MAG: 30S ribosomal protein S9 [Candidatus Margulisbacteria bacterium GWF2_35_9]|nr:MAG: 30S ribosomal protein S9 [Candidatus Margulisbacteria bacterium GWF2_35_9]
MNKVRYYATGKRKTSIARVWLVSGSGEIVINDQKLEEINGPFSLKTYVIKPLVLTNTRDRYDVKATVKGGGTTGQAEAVMYGIAKVLNNVSEEYRRILKTEGLLTRDCRIVERKKYGKKKARKGTQYRKR